MRLQKWRVLSDASEASVREGLRVAKAVTEAILRLEPEPSSEDAVNGILTVIAAYFADSEDPERDMVLLGKILLKAIIGFRHLESEGTAL